MRLGRRKNSGIPRKDLTARHVVEVLNQYGMPQITTTAFTLQNCTVQPYQADELLLQPDGMAIRDAYTIYTDTPATSGVEGGNTKADEISLYDGWYKVVQASPWQVGVISHWELIVVRKQENLV